MHCFCRLYSTIRIAPGFISTVLLAHDKVIYRLGYLHQKRLCCNNFNFWQATTRWSHFVRICFDWVHVWTFSPVMLLDDLGWAYVFLAQPFCRLLTFSISADSFFRHNSASEIEKTSFCRQSRRFVLQRCLPWRHPRNFTLDNQLNAWSRQCSKSKNIPELQSHHPPLNQHAACFYKTVKNKNYRQIVSTFRDISMDFCSVPR